MKKTFEIAMGNMIDVTTGTYKVGGAGGVQELRLIVDGDEFYIETDTDDVRYKFVAELGADEAFALAQTILANFVLP